jgi:hypothetical protein
MAITRRRTLVANRSRPRKRRNARRTLTRAQKLAGFGGKRAQSSAKHRRRRTNASTSPAPKRRRRAKPVTHRRKARRNPGEILSVLLNSGSTRRKKGHKMAAPKRRRRRARRATANPRRRRRTRRASTHRRRTRRASAVANPRRRRRTRRNYTRHHRRGRRRANASRGGGGPFGSLTHIGISIAAAFGAKYLTQAILGASNTGFVGYIGNGLATAALAMVAKMFGYARYVNAIIAGGALQIAIRVASDYTPYGAQLAMTGLGDYQVSNWVTPQRYLDPLNSAQVQIPAGWAPQIAAPAGMGSAIDFDGLYGSVGTGGLYS